MNEAVVSIPNSSAAARIGATNPRSRRFWLIFCMRAEPVSIPKYRLTQPDSAITDITLNYVAQAPTKLYVAGLFYPPKVAEDAHEHVHHVQHRQHQSQAR